MRFRGASAGRLALTILAVIGIGGVPDSVKTWGEWPGLLDAWTDHGWVRILVWAVSVAVFTYPQWLPRLRQRFVDWQHSQESDRTGEGAPSRSIPAEPPPPAPSPPVALPSGAEYTRLSPEEILAERKGPTALDQIVAVKAYEGLRIRVSGIVKDVDSHSYRGFEIRFETDEGTTISATFVDGWEAQARKARTGVRIDVDGQIVGVFPDILILRDSHLPPR